MQIFLPFRWPIKSQKIEIFVLQPYASSPTLGSVLQRCPSYRAVL